MSAKWYETIEVKGLGLVFSICWVSYNMHLMRYLRPFFIPLCVSYFLYRMVNVYTNDVKSMTILDHVILVLKMENFDNFKCPMLLQFLGDLAGLLVVFGICNLLLSLWKIKWLGMKGDVVSTVYNLIKVLPAVQNELQKEREKLREGVEKDLKVKSRNISENVTALPSKGMASKKVLDLMLKCSGSENKMWQDGKCSGAVYHGDDDHKVVLNQAFGMYSLANPLHADVFPSLVKFESEIVSMVATLVGGDIGVRGCTTSGGTESIILAIKAHRDYYRDNHGIKNPELICCVTAHAAVDKACDLMDIKLIKINANPETYQADPYLFEKAIGPNTIMMYGSAPSFPQGTIDPIQDLAKLAVKYSIGLHVDCCLGGFVLPFMKKLGYEVPPFDFSVKGVSSMSVDTHKYGFALKGTSVVLYSNAPLRQCQYFCYPDWTGGLYTTPTIAGSRSGGMIAQCWASMMSIGEEGYMAAVEQIVVTTRKIADEIQKIKGIKTIGGTQAMIVCITSTDNGPNIYKIGDAMTKKGWSLNSLQNPASIHLCVTKCHIGKEKTFLKDLKDSIALASKDQSTGGNAGIYGMTSALPPGPVGELLKEYNDSVLAQ
jgi:sphinganine-1-phosphate aldolase